MEIPSKEKKFCYICITCGNKYDDISDVIYLCPECSVENTAKTPPAGVLKTVYNYPELRRRINSFDDLKANDYLELLPIKSTASLPPLRTGKTPLYKIDHLDGRKLPFHLYIKDDGQNPTFSYKDRASALVSAFAKEMGIKTIVTASTGNAGSSIAGICASQHQNAIVLVPERSPRAKLCQILMYGAQLLPVKGTYDQAFDLSIRISETHRWYNRNTAYNPVTIEGKKTASFEIYDKIRPVKSYRIFVPTGDGVILSGVYKGFEDLLNLGIIDQMPQLVAVQSEGSDNLTRNIDSPTFSIRKSLTIADSIAVDVPRNFYYAKQMINKYSGEYITVSDQEIISASLILARNTGVFSEPAAAAAFAGMLRYYREDRLKYASHNIVLLTGSGLKDTGPVERKLEIPSGLEPDVDPIDSNMKNSLRY